MLKLATSAISLSIAIISAIALGIYLSFEKIKKGSTPDPFIIGLAMAGTVYAAFSVIEFFLSPTSKTPTEAI